MLSLFARAVDRLPRLKVLSFSSIYMTLHAEDLSALSDSLQKKKSQLTKLSLGLIGASLDAEKMTLLAPGVKALDQL